MIKLKKVGKKEIQDKLQKVENLRIRFYEELVGNLNMDKDIEQPIKLLSILTGELIDLENILKEYNEH